MEKEKWILLPSNLGISNFKENIYEICESGIRKLDIYVKGKGNSQYLKEGFNLTIGKNDKGYLTVNLFKKHYRFSILLAKIYIPNSDPKKTWVHHIDENSSNCTITNLEWVTPKKNSDYSKEKRNKAVREKILKGKNHPGIRAVIVYDVLLKKEIEYFSATEAAKQLNVSVDIIYWAIKKKSIFKKKKYTVKYKNPKEKIIISLKDLPNEVWKDISYTKQGIDFTGHYQLSNYGRIKSLKYDKERILKERKNKDSYCFVILSKGEKRIPFYPHQYVLDYFSEVPDNRHALEVDHIKNKSNNHVDNLRYVTHEKNMENAGKAGLLGSYKISVIQTNKITKKESRFGSISDANKTTGISAGHICAACQGKRKSAGGSFWSYEDAA